MMPRVVGIGEILWDRFPDGDRLGGAPANFAFHAAQLGASASIVSRVGRDADGDRLVDVLEQRGLTTEFIQRDSIYPTGLVWVKLNHGQPSYVIASPTAWDYLELTADLEKLAVNLDAVCFGTLAQRHPISRQIIQEFLRLCPMKSLRLFDINLREDQIPLEAIEFGLSQATVLKLNGEELVRLADLLGRTGQGQPEEAISKIFQRYSIELIAVTHGGEGSDLWTRNRVIRSKATKIDCIDAVGAGDAFSAVLVTGLLAGQSLEEVSTRANQIGAYVASQAGAMPALPQEYK